MSWLADNFTPMWIVWFLVVGLVVIILGVVLRLHRRGDSFRDTVGMSPFTLLMITLYASSVLLGPLATAFSSPTRVDWWQMAAVRVAWQLGGGILLGAALLWEARYGGRLGDWRVWAAFVALVVVGGLLCTSSLRDLIDGPMVLHGKPTFAVERTHGVRGAGSIFATLTLQAPDGTPQEIDLSGWEANLAEDRLADCKRSDEIDVTILRHIDAVLDVTCKVRRASSSP